MANDDQSPKRPVRNTTIMGGIRALDRYPLVRSGHISLEDLGKIGTNSQVSPKDLERKQTTPDGSAITPQRANLILPEEEAPTYSDDNAIPIDMVSPVENTRPTPVVLVKDKGAREFFLSAVLIALIYFQFKLAKLIEWIKCRRKY